MPLINERRIKIMRYIRTKNRIYELMFPHTEQQMSFDHQTIEPAYYSINNEWVAKRDVIKYANTIEELCDEFVIEHLDGDRDIFINYDLHCYHRGDNYYNFQFNNVGNYDGNLYGAIWTNKGLIYVAKMNEKGVLELL